MGWLRILCFSVGLLASFSLLAAPPVETDSAYSSHLEQLRKRLPSEFTIVLQHPFVVIGDEDGATVRRRSTNTVKWAVSRLKKDFFTRDPNEIIDIWLFKDKASYERHARDLFGDTPSTPFGYYSAAHRALIMNIATGGGTLVHEIVHPFMEANFPNCPAWFNEGMGSLFEHSEDRNGHIYGLTNWRLPALQTAIRQKKVPSFETLLSTSTAEFYGQGAGYNQHYAQARYLCYYLQEKGLLRTFYREFTATSQHDHTGLTALRKVLRTDDLSQFQKQWEAFVLALHE